MQIFIKYTWALCCLLLIAGCRKAGIEPGYKGKAAVALAGTLIPNSSGDSAVISFGTRPVSQQDSVVDIAVRVTGATSSSERHFSVVVIDSVTTAEPSEYVLPADFSIPANSIQTSFPLVLKRTSRLKTNTARLTLAIRENENFVSGPVNGRFSPLMKIIWNDKLVRPSSWSPNFGTYSDKKYQIIIEQTGYTTYNVHPSVIYQILFIVQEYVADYNNTHPGNPLRDENGNLVSFP